ncbi:MAG: endonuclease domain-containing protein [Patescibacteria group bacterium]
MSQHTQFVFKRYEFEANSGELRLYYGYDDSLEFCEYFKFDFEFTDYDEAALDRALQLLFFMAGVSYYKLYLAPEIVVQAGDIDESLAAFLSKTYQRGLGEFFYVNRLDPETPITFPPNTDQLEPVKLVEQTGQLIGLGGGKDSLLSVELLRDQTKVATWSLNHHSQLEPLVEKVGLPHFSVEREWDKQLKSLNEQGALNGHVPISAIFACVGAVVSILTGYKDNVVSNESSASEPTLNYRGVDINHQYSKSLEYEQDFQAIISQLFGDGLRYYSFLRPLSELHIAELFAQIGFTKYKDVFSSCNRAFRHNENHLFWCGECAKCAFVFLILTPFIERNQLESLWGGKNLLLDASLQKTYKQLLGLQGDKPLDCVGEVKESRAAMRLAQEIYPELSHYKFDLSADYDFRSWSAQALPSETYDILRSKLTNQQSEHS